MSPLKTLIKCLINSICDIENRIRDRGKSRETGLSSKFQLKKHMSGIYFWETMKRYNFQIVGIGEKVIVMAENIFSKINPKDKVVSQYFGGNNISLIGHKTHSIKERPFLWSITGLDVTHFCNRCLHLATSIVHLGPYLLQYLTIPFRSLLYIFNITFYFFLPNFLG